MIIFQGLIGALHNYYYSEGQDWFSVSVLLKKSFVQFSLIYPLKNLRKGGGTYHIPVTRYYTACLVDS